jgi:ribosomal protein L13E
MHHIKATVTKHNGKEVQGKGFSPNEMTKAGVNKNQMLKMGMPMDYKRKTAHDGNVAAIKAHLEHMKSHEKPKAPKPEKAQKK